MRSYCPETVPCGECSISLYSIKLKAIGGNKRCSRPLELLDPTEHSILQSDGNPNREGDRVT
jgi:hypothetical protein